VSRQATLSQVAAALTVAIVLAGGLLSGPLFGVGPPDSTELGEGTASVASVSIPVEEVVVNEGRFGTGTWYLRVPDATVAVDGVEGDPRLVARIEVPGLNVDSTDTKQLTAGATGRHRLALGSIPLGPNRPGGGPYRGRLTVRVQSFSVDQTVYNQSVAVEVER
jgi:hypothetical protein